ncbi:MAG: hypothetical protein RL662_1543 [Bacteroidota bacterium]|jgi:O-antigen/teichoic acid export membrane protein
MSFTFIFLARELTVEEYGEYGILKSTIDSFLVFATAGLSITATRFITDPKYTKYIGDILGLIFGLVFFTGFFVALSISFFSDFISSTFLHKENLSLGLKIASITLLFTAYNAIQQGTLLGFKDFRGQTLVNIVHGLTFFCFVVVSSKIGKVDGAILGGLLGMAITVVYSSYRVKKITNKSEIQIKIRTTHLKEILSFSIPAVASSLIVVPMMWVLNVILVNQDDGYLQLGIYNAVYIIPSIITLMNNIIGNSMLPFFLEKDKKDNYKRKLQLNYLANWLIAIFICFVIVGFQEFISFILGANYPLEKIKSILILSLSSSILIALRQGIARNLILKNKMWLSVYSMLQYSATTLFVFYFILKGRGAEGLSLSIFIGYVSNTFLFTPYFVYKQLAPSNIFFDKRIIFIAFFSLIVLIANIYPIPVIFRFLFLIISFVIIVSFLKKYLNDKKIILDSQD